MSGEQFEQPVENIVDEAAYPARPYAEAADPAHLQFLRGVAREQAPEREE